MSEPVYAAPQHRHLCARAAAALLRAREQGYPAAIKAKKLTPVEAERGIHLARCIVEQWRWIMDKAKPPCPAWDEKTDLFGAYSFEIEAELRGAAVRQRAIANRKANDAGAAELADLYDALAWLQRTRRGVAWVVMRVDVERSAAARASARTK